MMTRKPGKAEASAGVPSSKRYARAKDIKSGTLADFLARSPLRGLDIDLERLDDEPRPLDL